MTTEEQLTKFREEWDGIHVLQEEDALIYKVAPGFGRSASERANRLISAMELPLIATPTTLITNDSFTVKIKQDENNSH